MKGFRKSLQRPILKRISAPELGSAEHRIVLYLKLRPFPDGKFGDEFPLLVKYLKEQRVKHAFVRFLLNFATVPGEKACSHQTVITRPSSPAHVFKAP